MSNHTEAQVARRTNYGFEKKQRELRKKKKKEKKAERRGLTESPDSAPASGEAANENSTEPGPRDSAQWDRVTASGTRNATRTRHFALPSETPADFQVSTQPRPRRRSSAGLFGRETTISV